MDINGKIAIVSGAASGIGRAAAIALANKGARGIAIVDRDEAGIEETCRMVEAAGARALPLPLDVTDTAALQGMYASTDEAFGAIDIVFNNAGIVSGPPPFPDTDLERMRLVIEIDLIAVTQSTALGIRYMRERGGGAIVNTASTGAVNPLPSDATYAGAKAGVAHLSVSCGVFAETHNIRVNAICPGVTETPILDHTGGGKRPDWLGPILENIKVLTPEDIAARFIDIVEQDMAGAVVVVENEPVAG